MIMVNDDLSHYHLSALFPVASKAVALKPGVGLKYDLGFGESGNYDEATSI